MKTRLLIITALILGIFLRFYQLDNIPPGLNIDEASFGYNAYSLSETGKDRFGQPLPIVFRSFGTYLLPLYTYLTVIPVKILGLSVFSTRFVAAISSSLVILLTSILIFRIKAIDDRSKILIVFLLAISPWAILFGRGGHESSFSLALFVTSILFFVGSLSNPKWIIPTFLVIGFLSYTYYSELYVSLIFFPLLFLIFKNKFIKYKKHILIGIFALSLLQIPNLFLLNSAALTRRAEQVNYWSQGNLIYVLGEFTSHYLEYFSPKSLFFETDPQGARSIPDLSIFYIWMIIPLWFGAKILLRKKSEPFFKTLLLLVIVSPVPAALTKDPFYTMRAQVLFWTLTIIIGLGSSHLLGLLNSAKLKLVLVVFIFTISLISLYSSYFILLKYEREDNFGFKYQKLADKMKENHGRKFVIDSDRTIGAHIWIPFYEKVNPRELQANTSNQIKNDYYNNTELDRVTRFDNIEIRPIFWENDTYQDQILVSDELGISESQIKEHKLTPLFLIVGLDGKIKLIGYTTNPKASCEEGFKKGISNHPKCDFFSHTKVTQ